MIAALSGGARQRVLKRLQGTPVGVRLMREQKALAPVLENREWLRSLPEGSLGREYLAFCERHNITASGLIAASEEAVANEQYSVEDRLVQARMRDAHDLWHVVLGYKTDLIGEACVLAFTLAQTRNPAIGLIVASAFFNEYGDRRARQRLMAKALLRGLSASWFPEADWETLLTRPLHDVRRELRAGVPAEYVPFWSNEASSESSAAGSMATRAA